MIKLTGPPEVIIETLLIKLEEYTGKQVVVMIAEKETKEMRTLAQNNTFWLIFDGIAKKLGYSKEVVKQNILTSLFGTYEVRMFGETHLVPKITSTAELTKEEGIQLIDASLAYAEKIGAGIKITPREITNLYNSYK